MNVPPPVVVDTPRLRRPHRALTIPAGLLLFVCLFLPGYTDCGHPEIHPTGEDPILVAIGVYGLLVASSRRSRSA